MNRLKDIKRQQGYPICAETLEVLSENSEMLNEFLKFVPLKENTAVFFRNRNYILVCQNGVNRIVKTGSITATDLSSAKVVFSSENGDVEDSLGNTYENVFATETASVVTTNTESELWKFLELTDVFEAGVWENLLPVFSAGMSCSTSTHGFRYGTPSLLNTGNVLKTNGYMLRIKLDIELTFEGARDTIVRIPFPYLTGDQRYPIAGVLIDYLPTANTYPVFAYIVNGELVIEAGRWLKDEAIGAANRIESISTVLHINTEIVL